MDSEISSDIKEAKVKKGFSGELVDSKYVIRYSINKTSKEGKYDYTDYTKIFDTIEEFNSYTQTFFEE